MRGPDEREAEFRAKHAGHEIREMEGHYCDSCRRCTPDLLRCEDCDEEIER